MCFSSSLISTSNTFHSLEVQFSPVCINIAAVQRHMLQSQSDSLMIKNGFFLHGNAKVSAFMGAEALSSTEQAGKPQMIPVDAQEKPLRPCVSVIFRL